VKSTVVVVVFIAGRLIKLPEEYWIAEVKYRAKVKRRRTTRKTTYLSIKEKS